MTLIVEPPTWPADPEHCEAIDTLLVMAEAEARWGERARAADLLDNVEQIIGTLPDGFQQMRSRCRRLPDRAPIT